MGTKVVVVDDTDHVRAMLVEMLEVDGFSVVGQADSGPQGITVTVSTNPDVVVVDYMMSGMDGIETARQIRKRRPDQAIILYTAFLDSEVERRAREAGVALCVAKTDGLPVLERHIAELSREVHRAV